MTRDEAIAKVRAANSKIGEAGAELLVDGAIALELFKPTPNAVQIIEDTIHLNSHAPAHHLARRVHAALRERFFLVTRPPPIEPEGAL